MGVRCLVTWCLLGALLCLWSVQRADGAALIPYTDPETNVTSMVCANAQKIKCSPGVLIPVWLTPRNDVAGTAGRAFVYMIGMFFMFLGIAIISDRFMASIEIITSQEKEIKIKDKNSGKSKIVTVKIWNETVSNLTLMALGSSAPEILLSVIEIIGRGFKAGELGPSTIVGSAAFNLFMITAVCVSVLPPGQTRRIEHLSVFFFTASNSVGCYVWMYLILSVITPGVIDVWEGLITLAGMPFLVGVAYLIDVKFSFYRLLRKRIRSQKKGGHTVVQSGDGDIVALTVRDSMVNGDIEKHDDGASSMKTVDMELLTFTDGDDPADHMAEKKRIAMEAYHKAREKNPNADAATLQHLVEQENLRLQHKSRAFYRIQANKAMTGQGNLMRQKKQEVTPEDKRASDEEMELKQSQLTGLPVPPTEGCIVYFHPAELTVVESCGNVYLNVVRVGADLFDTIYVDYATSDGTANADSDFVHTEGMLVFKPGETSKTIVVPIIDDDIFELDEYFFCKLTGVRNEPGRGRHPAKISEPATATITVLDDDYPGVFTFEQNTTETAETCGFLTMRIVRLIGARGQIRVPYYTEEGSASGGGEDFEDIVGEIEFQDEETVKTVEIQIIDREEYEKNKSFNLVLGEPRIVKIENQTKIMGLENVDDEKLRAILEAGNPTLGEHRRCEVTIKECQLFRDTIDAMVGRANLASIIKSSSWADQVREAFIVEAGEVVQEEGEEEVEPQPNYFDYFMHYLSLFWKLLFAIVPPTDIWNGWGCFGVSLAFIGILTAVTGDIASHFGCTVGLADSVVAISFVALGTSLPDTFASKVATISDDTADSSIGNVTGSNSVNVYLGIGLAWTIAAVYHSATGGQFEVDPGSLGFSVLVFCCEALCCIALMMYRRFNPNIAAELGGPATPRMMTSCFCACLWFNYIMLSSLEAYCFIDPGF